MIKKFAIIDKATGLICYVINEYVTVSDDNVLIEIKETSDFFNVINVKNITEYHLTLSSTGLEILLNNEIHVKLKEKKQKIIEYYETKF
jgi:hypothetical protein